jgi:hypothetical protein
MTRTRALSLIAVVAATGTLLAVSPHWVVDPAISVDGTSLVLNAKAAGLGDVPEVSFTVTGTLDIFSRCYNHGGNKPQADNKQETVLVDASFSAPVRNGQTTISNQLVATVVSSLDCPGSQVVRIETFAYDLLLQAEGFAQLTTTLSSN